MNAALATVLLRLGPPLVESLLEIVTALLTRLIAGTPMEPSDVWTLARNIAEQTERDWPEISGDERRIFALGELDAALRRRGATPTYRDTAAVLELAVSGLGARL